MQNNIKNAAVVHNVNEVSLQGSADLDYWQQILKPEELEPVAKDGLAQVLLIAADARFLGLRFRELSFSVLARDVSGLTKLSGSYLIRAFNSRRLFAWIERTFFATPYYHGDVQVESEPPGFVLQLSGQRLAASLDFANRNPNVEYELSSWHGPVFLPRSHGTSIAESKLFFARLWNGRVEVPFDSGEDNFTLPDTSTPPFPELRASNFSPRLWICGATASHAKSKTYARGKCPAFSPEP
jgi:hypothetical protein